MTYIDPIGPGNPYPYWRWYQPGFPLPNTPNYTITVPSSWSANQNRHRPRVMKGSDGSWRFRCSHPCRARGDGYEDHHVALRLACAHVKAMAPRYEVWNQAATA